MKLQINGHDEVVEGITNLKQLLLSKKINPNVVACELNTKIIKRAQLDETPIKEGDVIEIIQMIGGG